jgi:predicted DNA-binding transcriptional regulator AlpA
MQTSTQPKRFLRIASVIERTGMSKPTIYQMIQKGRFPPSIKHGPRLTVVAERDLLAAIEAHKARIEKQTGLRVTLSQAAAGLLRRGLEMASTS